MQIRPDINARVIMHDKHKGTVYAHYTDKPNVVGVHLDPSASITNFKASWIKGINISCLEELSA